MSCSYNPISIKLNVFQLMGILLNLMQNSVLFMLDLHHWSHKKNRRSLHPSTAGPTEHVCGDQLPSGIRVPLGTTTEMRQKKKLWWVEVCQFLSIVFSKCLYEKTVLVVKQCRKKIQAEKPWKVLTETVQLCSLIFLGMPRHKPSVIQRDCLEAACFGMFLCLRTTLVTKITQNSTNKWLNESVAPV